MPTSSNKVPSTKMDNETSTPTRNSELYRSVFTKKVYSKLSPEEHFEKCDAYLEEESNVDFCSSKGKDGGKCTCLHILRQAPLRERVAQFLVDTLRSPDKDKRKLAILELHKQAAANRTKSTGKLAYPIPFNADGDKDKDDGASKLKDAELCQQGMCTVMGVTHHCLKLVRKAAVSTTDADNFTRAHGLTGKASNHSLDPELQSALEVHFTSSCKSATTTSEDGVICLSEPKTFHSCYQSFIEGRKDICSYRTYMSTWQRKYPHLKLTKQMKKDGEEKEKEKPEKKRAVPPSGAKKAGGKRSRA